MSDSEIQCKNCGRSWDWDTEQAACIEVYGKCIVCCAEAEHVGYVWSIRKVLEKQKEIIKCEADK